MEENHFAFGLEKTFVRRGDGSSRLRTVSIVRIDIRGVEQ